MPGFCSRPFLSLDVLAKHASTCCGDWLNPETFAHFGRVPEPDPWAIWNSRRIQRLRAAVLGGDFSLCPACPRRADRRLPRDKRHPRYKRVMATGPVVVNLGLDRSCNLFCRSCRPRRLTVEPTPRMRRFYQRLQKAYLPTVDLWSMSHTGDPFASELLSEWLRTFNPRPYPDLRVRLFTNGQALASSWPMLGPVRERIKAIWLSIDAATPGTYEKLRRGGSWENVESALGLISELTAAGQLDDSQINFVVQRDNYLEMPAFVRLGIGYRIRRVFFNLLRPRRHMPPGQFKIQDLSDETHPEAAEFAAICAMPIMQHPIVAEGTFRPAWQRLLRQNLR